MTTEENGHLAISTYRPPQPEQEIPGHSVHEANCPVEIAVSMPSPAARSNASSSRSSGSPISRGSVRDDRDTQRNADISNSPSSVVISVFSPARESITSSNSDASPAHMGERAGGSPSRDEQDDLAEDTRAAESPEAMAESVSSGAQSNAVSVDSGNASHTDEGQAAVQNEAPQADSEPGHVTESDFPSQEDTLRRLTRNVSALSTTAGQVIVFPDESSEPGETEA